MTTEIPKPASCISIEHIHATLLTEINTRIQQRDKYTKHSEQWRVEDCTAATLCWMFGPLTKFSIDSDTTRCEHDALQKELMDAADMPLGVTSVEGESA